MATRRRLLASAILLAALLVCAPVALQSEGDPHSIRIHTQPSDTAGHIPLSVSLSEAGRRAGPGRRPDILGPDGPLTAAEATDAPVLVVQKWADRASVYAGAQLTYTVAITNTGGVTLTTTITDILPAAVTPSGTITWTPEPLAPDATWTATLPVTVEISYRGTLTNVVQVTTLEGASGAYTATTEVVAPPGLELRKWADRASVHAGEQLTYTVALTNTGDVTLTATITDILPDAVTPSGTVTWTPEPLAPDATWTATLPVTVEISYRGTLTNVVQVTTLEGASGAYTATTEVVAPPGLELRKWADRASVHAGEQLTYTVAITNTGGVTLTATITDVLPAAVMPSGTITWTPPPLAPDAVWTATIPVTVEPSYLGTLTNTVEVATLEGVTGTYTTTTEVMATPRLEVHKWATPDPVVAGWPLTYTIRVTNTGNVTLHATVLDTLPAQVSSPSGMPFWTDIVLAPSSVWSKTFQVTVRADYVGRLINIVYVETSEGVEGACSALSDSIRGHRVYLPLVLRDW